MIANFGNPIPPRPAKNLEAVRAGLEDHLAAGGALLALHATITSMTTMPAWAREMSGHRMVYDALGHDTGSYESPGRQAVLRSSVRWLLA